MNLWNDSYDELNDALRHLGLEEPTFDQRLKIAEIKALLAIGAELSLIQDQGINPEWAQRDD